MIVRNICIGTSQTQTDCKGMTGKPVMRTQHP